MQNIFKYSGLIKKLNNFDRKEENQRGGRNIRDHSTKNEYISLWSYSAETQIRENLPKFSRLL